MINTNQKELLNGIKSYVDLKTDGEEGLVWADEFENGQWDGEKWHHNVWDISQPPYTWNPYHGVYDEELGRVVMELNTDLLGGDPHERLTTRQSFRDVTIEMKCKNGSFWVGAMPYQTYGINTLDAAEPFTGWECDMIEVYPMTNGWKTLNNNLHTETIHANDNIKAVKSFYKPKSVTADFWNKWHTLKMVIRDNLYEENPQDSMTIQWWCDDTKMGEVVYDTANYLDGSKYAKDREPVRRMGFVMILGGCNTKAEGCEDNRAHISEQPRFAYVKIYSNHPNNVSHATSYTKLDNKGKETWLINSGRQVDMCYTTWNAIAKQFVDYSAQNIPNFTEDMLLSLPSATWGQSTAMLDAVISSGEPTQQLKEYILKSMLGLYYPIGATAPKKKVIAEMGLNVGGLFKAYPLEANVIDLPELILDPVTFTPNAEDTYFLTADHGNGTTLFDQYFADYTCVKGQYKFGDKYLIPFVLPIKANKLPTQPQS